MKVDVHKALTTLFNVELNEFLARFDKEWTFEAVQTGGLMEVRVKEVHPFRKYVHWLKSFRDELFFKSADHMLEIDSFKEEMERLLQFYVNLKIFSEYHIFKKELETQLDKYFIKPFQRFLRSLDRNLRTNYFKRRVSQIEKLSPEMTVKVINFFKYPIVHTNIRISYVINPDFGKYSKTIPLCTLRTNETGIAKIKLTEGYYRVDVEKYGKRKFEELHENKEVEIRVFDLLDLLKRFVKKL